MGVRSPSRMRARIASRLGLFAATLIPSQFFFPACTERCFRQRYARALSGPCSHGIESSSIQPQSVEQTQTTAHHPSTKREQTWTQHCLLPDAELHASSFIFTCFGEVSPVMQQMMVQIDVHRTDAGAGAT